jgi:V/A-type H+-transporting ATPase subunit E
MSYQVQELIDKIKTEGIEAASSEAAQIKQNAQKEARRIVDEAQSHARQMVADAQQEIKKMRASAEMSLKQSSRDMLLLLRKRIEAVLNRVVHEEVSGALKPEQLIELIAVVIDKAMEQKSSFDVVDVSVNKKDLEHLQKGMIAKLQKKIKEPIEFKASDEISGGFTISFDGGKSSFDFTDHSLAQFLGQFLNTQVARIVKESV